MNTTGCTCTEPGYCSRHGVHKDAHYHMLCRTNPDYFRAWENGTGPNQNLDRHATAHDLPSSPPEKPGPGTELRKLLGSCCRLSIYDQMNEWDLDGCEANREFILSSLITATRERNICLPQSAASRLLSLALSSWQRKKEAAPSGT